MKEIFNKAHLQVYAMALCLGIIVAPLFSGCATPQQRGDTFATLMAASSAGMNMYVMVASQKCKGDAICEDNLNRTYSVYTNAVNAVTTAYIAYESSPTNRPVFLNAITALTAAQIDIARAIMAAQK